MPSIDQMITELEICLHPYSCPAQAQADIVLRSSDRVDFYVVKAFLRYVSPFFKDLFELDQEFITEEHEERKGLVVIPVMETSDTLRLLLDYIYPQETEPQLNDAALFLKSAKAAQKYCMEKIENKFKKRILDSSLMNSEPFRMYVIAVDLGWEDVATHAAQRTLNWPLKMLDPVNELRNISGSGFYRFLEYRLRCENSSNRSVEELAIFPMAASQPTTSSSNLGMRPNGEVDQTSGAIDAQTPFDSSATSDIILRSSDGIDFFVLEILIRIASPSLGLTILSETAKGHVRNGRAVVQIPEESSILHHMLCFIYPYSDQLDMHNCQSYIQVVLAIRRHGMAAIEARLRTQAASTPLCRKEPLRAYIVASALGWDDLAKSAALNTLYRPLADMRYTEEFNLITGADLQRLVSFRFRCADAACRVITSNTMYKTHGPGKWSLGPSPDHYGPTAELFSDLRIRPRGTTIVDAYKQETEQLGAHVYDSRASQRSSFGKSTLHQILQCRQEMEAAVEAAVTEVLS
ncbi:hypothetical protein APHAL10511_005257 [Amanita phalloides]|nr:hypothetical protein APHAL10511_005257 [Amanita phalloides]